MIVPLQRATAVAALLAVAGTADTAADCVGWGCGACSRLVPCLHSAEGARPHSCHPCNSAAAVDTIVDCSEQIAPRTANAQHMSPRDSTLVHRGTVMNPVPSLAASKWATARADCYAERKARKSYGQEEQEQTKQ